MQKIKQFFESEKGKDILIVLIVILVGLGAFGLGRLSKDSSSSSVQTEYPNGALEQTINQGANVISAINEESGGDVITTKTATTTTNTGKNYFASSRGKKYYPVECSAGKSLKQENRVYFATASDAEKAGYTLSSSCK